MKAWLRTALLGLGLGSIPAWGEPDSFGVGSGRDGPLTVSEPGRVINRYAQVSGPAAPGDTVLLVADTDGFSKGDLVMVLQATGLVPEPSPGGSKPIELSHDAVGQWEFARLSAKGEGVLALTAPLVNGYAAQVTQVIRVPEYTQLRIREGAEVRAAPWNGRTGGVVALLATGAVINEGTLSATGAGFRGGAYAPDAFEPALCLGMSVAARPGARKGEGIAVTQYGPTTTGRESVSHGGGGGLCPLAGGGGGGNGGPGGRGGGSTELTGEALGLGGEGGAKLVYSLANRLSFGGGGGSGQGEDELRPEGGAGGGAMFIRAHQLSGKGVIVADGAPGGVAGRGGAGGGGAGGSVYLRFDASAECGGVFARGGAGGGASPYLMGAGVPGGGGGGGRILFQTASRGDCLLGVEVGAAGVSSARTGLEGSRNEAQPSRDERLLYSGIVHQDDNVAGVAPTVITLPAPDAYVNTDKTGLVVKGTAEPLGEVKVSVNGRESSEGVDVADAQGNWEVKISKLPNGNPFADHQRYSIKAGSSNEQYFTADLVVPTARITNNPPAKTQDSITFEFTHDDCKGGVNPSCSAGNLYEDVEFKCSRDGSFYESCNGGSKTYAGLNDGKYTFHLQVKDEVNKGLIVTRNWVVDKTKPVVTIDEKPSARTKSSDAKFVFHANETASFRCVLDVDGVVLSDEWSCPSPHSYSGLGQGNYTFEVSAKDDVGNTSVRVRHQWVIDQTGPDARILTKPPLQTNSRSATFSFDSEPGATFECALDAGPYGTCAGSKSYDLLGNGSHTFFVRALDDVGNTGKPVGFSWVVDFAPPVSVITEYPEEFTIKRDAKFVFTADKVNVSYFCALSGHNGGGFEQCGSSGQKSYFALADGTYTFRVQAIDSLGNIEAIPAERSWTIDTTPPRLVIKKPLDGGMSNTPYVTVEGESDPGITVSLSFDGGKSPVQVKADLYNGSWQFKADFALTEGVHDLRAEVVDWARRQAVQEIRFTVNTFRPETDIVSGPPSPYKSGTAQFLFSSPNVPESRRKDVEYRCRLDEGADSPCDENQEYFKLKNGLHRLQVCAWLDGNEDLSPAVYQWEVRIEPPLPPDILEPVDGGRVDTGSPTISGRSIPKGRVHVFVDGAVSGIAFPDSAGMWTFMPSPALVPGPHTVDAAAEDELGNMSDKNSAKVSFVIEIPSDVRGYGEGGGGLSCSAGGATPFSMLFWGLLALLGVSRRRC